MTAPGWPRDWLATAGSVRAASARHCDKGCGQTAVPCRNLCGGWWEVEVIWMVPLGFLDATGREAMEAGIPYFDQRQGPGSCPCKDRLCV